MENKVEYIGDGVYAEFDGYNIWLKTNDPHHPTDNVCIEPPVLRGLIRFAEKLGIKLEE